jgi:hypothetical protein
MRNITCYVVLAQDEAESILAAELGKMPRELLRETIDEARSECSRNGKKFTYISARNLFDAIEAAKSALAGEADDTATGGR